MANTLLTGKQRAALRGMANGITPVFQVGKGGVDKAVGQAAAICLAKRELVKLKLLETCPQTPQEAAAALAEGTGAQVVQVIGRAVVLFLPKKKESAFGGVLKMR